MRLLSSSIMFSYGLWFTDFKSKGPPSCAVISTKYNTWLMGLEGRLTWNWIAKWDITAKSSDQIRKDTSAWNRALVQGKNRQQLWFWGGVRKHKGDALKEITLVSTYPFLDVSTGNQNHLWNKRNLLDLSALPEGPKG